MYRASSLPLLPGQWMVVFAGVSSIGQIQIFNHFLNLKPFTIVQTNELCPVGWGCRIYRLLLCRGVRPSPNESPGYGTKQSDGEVPIMLEH